MGDLFDVSLDFFKTVFPDQNGVSRGNITALALQGIDEALLFQFVVGVLGGKEADAQVFRQAADGWKKFVLLKITSNNLITDLGVDLIVDGLAALVVQKDIHGITSIMRVMTVL